MPQNTLSISKRRNRSWLASLVQAFATEEDDEIDPRPPKKKYNKFYFRELCDSSNIINEKHYQHCLISSIELKKCEIYLNPSQLEGYKKLIFIHNFKRIQQVFEMPKIYEIRDRNILGIVCRFLKTIALENRMSHEELVSNLTRWYFKINHKKLGLICYGHTNSGKSLLAHLLTSQFQQWEIGAFSCPPGTNISQFYLDALLNTYL